MNEGQQPLQMEVRWRNMSCTFFNLWLPETSLCWGYSWGALRKSRWKASFQQAQEGSLVAGVQRPWVIILRPLQRTGGFLRSRAFLLTHLVTFCETIPWHRPLSLEKILSLVQATRARLIFAPPFEAIISSILAFCLTALRSTRNTLMLHVMTWLSSHNWKFKDGNVMAS